VYDYPGRLFTSASINLQGEDYALPDRFELASDPLECYPVPFNRSVTVKYHVPSPTRVVVDICDVRPQRIRRLVDQDSPPLGVYTLMWNGRDEQGQDVADGYYWAVLQTDSILEKRLLVLSRTREK
jgi:hypothetical protein